MRWTRTDKAILENIILFTQSSRSNWTESVEDDSELEDDSSTSWWKIISAKIAKLCTLPIMCITDMSGFVFEPEIRKDSSWFWHIPTRIEGSYVKRGGPTRRRLQVSVVVIKKYWKATWSGGGESKSRSGFRASTKIKELVQSSHKSLHVTEWEKTHRIHRFCCQKRTRCRGVIKERKRCRERQTESR